MKIGQIDSLTSYSALTSLKLSLLFPDMGSWCLGAGFLEGLGSTKFIVLKTTGVVGRGKEGSMLCFSSTVRPAQ